MSAGEKMNFTGGKGGEVAPTDGRGGKFSFSFQQGRKENVNDFSTSQRGKGRKKKKRTVFLGKKASRGICYHSRKNKNRSS